MLTLREHSLCEYSLRVNQPYGNTHSVNVPYGKIPYGNIHYVNIPYGLNTHTETTANAPVPYGNEFPAGTLFPAGTTPHGNTVNIRLIYMDGELYLLLCWAGEPALLRCEGLDTSIHQINRLGNSPSI